MIQDVELAVGIFAGGQLNAFNAQYDVFQWLRVQTDLGVGDIWVDDHQVIDIYRVELILDQKLSFAPHNVKKLQVAVGMGHGMPVAAVFGTGYIQQFCGTADCKSLLPVQAVMTSAHKNLPDFMDIDILLHFLAFCNTAFLE